MKPDLGLFLHHLQETDFQIGIDESFWGVFTTEIEKEWPFVIIWIRAKEKENSPTKYYFRFDLTGYPASAPTGCPWNIETNNRLENENWPKGGINTNTIFNPSWNPNALYIPCDRRAQPGHEIWRMRHPQWWWNPTDNITKYLSLLHLTLNAKDYAG